MTTHGLRCHVYTTPDFRGCGVISARYGAVTLLDPRITPPGVALREPTRDAPAVRFNVHRGMWDTKVLTVRLAIEHPTGANGPMSGGGFVYSRDERFAAILAEHGLTDGPVPFHDHYEFSNPENRARFLATL